MALRQPDSRSNADAKLRLLRERLRGIGSAEGIRHAIIETEELDVPGFAENPPDRCYYCKRELFGRILSFAKGNGLNAVLEGSNIDDDADYRPGRRAIRELGIVSPLHEVGLAKAEIRALTRGWGSRSCVSARMATWRVSRCRPATFRVSPRGRRGLPPHSGSSVLRMSRSIFSATAPAA